MKLQILLALALLMAGCATPADDPGTDDMGTTVGFQGPTSDDSGDDSGNDDSDESAWTKPDCPAKEEHEHEEGTGAHDHPPYEVPECEGVPQVYITATPDAVSGINVYIELQQFLFAPLNVSTDHQAGEGHGHIYLDGVKLGRVYTNWVHVAADEGEHEIRVTLNGNDHSDLTVNGELVQDIVTVTVPEPPGGMHHGSLHDGSEMSVDVTAHADPMNPSSQVIEIQTEGFTFNAEGASSHHVQGEGHAHIYLDGVKLGRVYGNYYHLGGLEEGEYQVSVTLNGNDHGDYMDDQQPVSDTVTITVGEEDHSGHH